MIEDKGIFIKNIYYMLSYAFHILRQGNYEEIESEEFEGVEDLLAFILSKGISKQLKQGLYKEYRTKCSDLMTLKGKLHTGNTVKNYMERKRYLSCEYDELSRNNIFNQILKITILTLIQQKNIKEKRKLELRKILLYFSDLDTVNPTYIPWSRITYTRNNQNYKMLLYICRFILQDLLLSTEKGQYKMKTFFNDDKMHSLYENFVLEYFKRHHPQLNPSSSWIKWNVEGNMHHLLPNMKTDITLTKENRTLIIDTKYYSNVFKTNPYYNNEKLHSNNLYQIFSYVKNKDIHNTGNVSGVLLYAKTNEDTSPNCEFNMGGNKIGVRTLDLNKEFRYIVNQLEELLYFLE